jgi:hypothetical protein
MPSISTRADMNSRAARRRSHRRGIKQCDVSNRGNRRVPADQAAEGGVRHHFIPVIEIVVERKLALHARGDGAKEGGHPQ